MIYQQPSITRHVPMYNLQELMDIVPHVVIDELWIEASEIRVVNVLEDKGRCFALHKV